MADTIIYYKKRKERTMKRKHLITIGVIIAIVLLLYWLFYSRRLECLAQCKLIFSIIMRGCSDK